MVSNQFELAIEISLRNTEYCNLSSDQSLQPQQFILIVQI